ncbi:hypothetical protein ACIBI4_06160 [Streptomyces sp. NPDC050418]|uniref:hypothetical protein n=1 Tax=Streptomyces sp. NPDC050418 TaxID=3365612 RepID=UPI00378CD925
MAYRASEAQVLAIAWDRYPRTNPAARVPAPRRTRFVSGDAMRWTPTAEPIRSHP